MIPELVTLDQASISANAKKFHEIFTKNGCCIIRLTSDVANIIEDAMTTSTRLFSQPREKKVVFSDNETRVGFRSAGIEYSRSPDRPDLMESLSYCHRYDSIIENLISNEIEKDWREKSKAAFIILDNIFTLLLNTLYSHTYTEPQKFYRSFPESISAKGSFLQLNNYTANLMSRSTLQDSHEDGNILTLLSSDAEGLELSLDDQEFIGCVPPSGCLLAFSGSLMTKLSKGRYPTVYHRVMRYPHVSERKSMMYFANPAADQTVYPWGDVQGENLAEVASENAELFGLPKIG